MSRQEFPIKVRKAAYDRAAGICECGCGVPFGKERVEYDHVIPARLGGDNSLENCKALRLSCHKAKTRSDLKSISKVRRAEKQQRGFEARKAVIPGSKKSRFKKRVDGTVVDRVTGQPV